MHISPRALEGSRRHRLVVGTMLFLVTLLIALALTVTAFGDRVGPWMRAGLGAGALAMYSVAWWCARYWYAAFCEGRREEAVAELNPWPWMLPWGVLVVALAVTGVRELGRGDSGGWIVLGIAGVFASPALAGLIGGLVGLVRSPRRRGSAVAPPPPEPQRPHRNWGPIGRD